jgi:hypothetical protein
LTHSASVSTTSVVITKTTTKPILSTQISSGSTGSSKKSTTTRKTPLCKGKCSFCCRLIILHLTVLHLSIWI